MTDVSCPVGSASASLNFYVSKCGLTNRFSAFSFVLLPLYWASTDTSKLAQSIKIPDSSSSAQNSCIMGFFFSVSLQRWFEKVFLFDISCLYQDLHTFKSPLLASIFPILHFHFPNMLLELSPGERIEEKKKT